MTLSDILKALLFLGMWLVGLLWVTISARKEIIALWKERGYWN